MKVITPQIAKGKNVLVRLDTDVPLNLGRISDDSRLKEALPTLKTLNSAKRIVILGHLGRPKGSDSKFSLKPVAKKLSTLLKKKVVFAEDVSKIPEKGIVCLENLRFYSEEQKSSKSFAKMLAKYGDLYVNESFASVHRSSASISVLPKFLPSYAGLHLAHELEANRLIKSHIKHPFILVLGGAKLDKLSILSSLIKKADGVLIGGTLMFSFLKAQGFEIGKSKCDDDLVLAKKLLKQKKILLPIDVVLDNKKTVDIAKIPKSRKGMDIGKKTIKEYEDVLSNAHTIVWNGSLGFAEKKPFDHATKELAKIITSLKVISVVGGGDTTAAISSYLPKFTHASTAGGAFLALIGGQKLPGVKALK